MKKILILTLCLTSQLAFSQVPEILIKNFTGTYAQESGAATAETFKYAETEFRENSAFEMFKQGGVFILKTPDQEVELDEMPENINELHTLNFSSVNLKMTSELVEVEVPSLEGTSTDEKRIDIQNLILKCAGDLSSGTPKDALLDTCFNKKGDVSLDKFETGKDQMKDLAVQVENNILNFSAKVGGLKARGWGTSEYRASENKIVLRVDKVKVGFLSVTGRFFSELSKEPNENIVINRPYIEILLD